MTRSTKTATLLLPAGLCALTIAHAQAPLYDPAQLPSITGQVQQFTLTPRGDIDGVILSDGTEVKTPPGLSTSVAYSVKPGDTVIIHGLRAAAIPLVQAVSITDSTSGKTIVESDPGPGPGPGPGPRPPGPRGVGLSQAAAQGTVRMTVHGPRGEVNGVLLNDGTVLRLPPDAAVNLASLLQPGKTIVAQGDGVTNAMGKVLEVREIGASRDSLTPVIAGPPPPPGAR